jgi:RNA polymerase sigma factor (sigma-70 family)
MQSSKGCAALGDGAGLTDRQLMDRFIARRDDNAFEALVRRHGPMVLGVCRRVIGDEHEAEDTFQATFLVLARKAATVVSREQVGCWLYGVAYRTALEARTLAARRRRHEMQVKNMPQATVGPEEYWRDWLPLLDCEMSRVPAAQRATVVLCEQEGRTRKEAAALLDVPEGTVSSRLAAARRTLARRLAARGVAVSGVGLAAALSPKGVSAALVETSVAAVNVLAAGGALLPKVADLTNGVLKAMLFAKVKSVAVALLAIFSADTRFLAGKGYKEKAYLWDVEAQKQGDLSTNLAKHVRLVRFSADGKALVGISDDGEVKVWDTATGKEIAALAGFPNSIHTIAMSADGRSLARRERDGKIKVWDLATGKEQAADDPGALYTAVALSANGKLLAAAVKLRQRR